MASAPLREEETQRDTQGEWCAMTKGRDWSGVSTSPACQGFPATPEAKRKAWSRLSLRTLLKKPTLPIPWLCSSNHRNSARIHLCPFQEAKAEPRCQPLLLISFWFLSPTLLSLPCLNSFLLFLLARPFPCQFPVTSPISGVTENPHS